MRRVKGKKRSEQDPHSNQAVAQYHPNSNNPYGVLGHPESASSLTQGSAAISSYNNLALHSRENTILLLREVQQLARNQQALQEELLRLRRETGRNPDGSMMDGTLAVPDAAAPVVEPLDKAVVVIDLLKRPPQVLTANGAFCRLLGYDMHEIVGQRWDRLVHPAFQARSLTIFSAIRFTDTVEFEQCYCTKDGQCFFSVDSHTFLLAGDGRPMQDLVTLNLRRQPSPAAAALAGIDLSAVTAGAPQHVLAGRPPSLAIEDAAHAELGVYDSTEPYGYRPGAFAHYEPGTITEVSSDPSSPASQMAQDELQRYSQYAPLAGPSAAAAAPIVATPGSVIHLPLGPDDQLLPSALEEEHQLFLLQQQEQLLQQQQHLLEQQLQQQQQQEQQQQQQQLHQLHASPASSMHASPMQASSPHRSPAHHTAQNSPTPAYQVEFPPEDAPQPVAYYAQPHTTYDAAAVPEFAYPLSSVAPESPTRYLSMSYDADAPHQWPDSFA